MDSTVRAARDAVLERAEPMPPGAVGGFNRGGWSASIAGTAAGRGSVGAGRSVVASVGVRRDNRKGRGSFGGAGQSSVSHGATSGGHSFGGGHAGGGGGHFGGGGHGGGGGHHR